MSERYDCQSHMTTLLTAALVGVGLPAQAVYGYRVFDFAGQSPVVVVSALGTDYTQARGEFEAPVTYGGRSKVINLDVFSFALWSESGTSYTNEDAEQQLADIEQRIETVVRNNQETAYWQEATYRNETVVSTVVLGGTTYRVEDVNLRLRIA